MSKSTRVTLTKTEAASAYGQRLIHQIMAMSDDGALTLEEVRVLHRLVMEGPTEMNAVPFLRLRTVRILLDNQLDQVEMYQLRRDMERVVPKEVRDNLTILLSRIGLPTEEGEEATGQAWHGDPITARQREFIRDLGGECNESMTKGQASALIDSLLERRPPSPRQQMVLRFFDRLDMMAETKENVSIWLDGLYAQHEEYERAWHLFKDDIGDDGTVRDPSVVPIGAYRRYLRPRTAPTVPATKRMIPAWMLIVVVAVGLVLAYVLFCR
jgi:hypothetical protein